MRSRWLRTSVVALIATASLVTVPASGADAAGPGWPVDGVLAGPGGFEFRSCGGTVTEVGSGFYLTNGMGAGTYAFEVCVTVSGAITFVGSITFTTRSGAVLNGEISGAFEPPGGPTWHVRVTGGTKRFSGATGSLTIGPLVQSDMHNCDPRVGICLDWTDFGPISGRLFRVRT
jgi:hypothetical protein